MGSREGVRGKNGGRHRGNVATKMSGSVNSQAHLRPCPHAVPYTKSHTHRLRRGSRNSRSMARAELMRAAMR